jgi:hypothetical protein
LISQFLTITAIKPLGKLKVTRSISNKIFLIHPAQTPMSMGGMRPPPMGTQEGMETETAPVEESWCHWAQDFPPRRESVLAGCLSCPPLLESKEQEKENLSKKKTKRRNERWFPAGNEGDIYSLGASCRYSNG